jgi:predicted dehydrogenase
MSEGKLKVAVLGLNDGGRLLLEAASQIHYFQIQAIADKDTNLVEKTAQEYNCAGYDDYRQLIIQNQFDCLLVAAPVHTCAEHIRTAIKKRFDILKLAPPARSFQEAVQFVSLAEQENARFAVANPSRFARGFLALRRFLQEGRIEQIFLVTACCTVGNRDYPVWQADPKLAGGGVLLNNCYAIIDQMTSNFSLAQQVHSLTLSTAGDRRQRLYLTEDTALVTMKFSDTFIGSLTASRCIATGPEQQFMKIYGKDKILTVSDTRFVVSDSLGHISERFEYDDDRFSRYTGLLESFALSILSPDKNRFCSSGRENLKNMAVIESAYLSARTAMPEQPPGILQMAQREPRNIQQG